MALIPVVEYRINQLARWPDPKLGEMALGDEDFVWRKIRDSDGSLQSTLFTYADVSEEFRVGMGWNQIFVAAEHWLQPGQPNADLSKWGQITADLNWMGADLLKNTYWLGVGWMPFSANSISKFQATLSFTASTRIAQASSRGGTHPAYIWWGLNIGADPVDNKPLTTRVTHTNMSQPNVLSVFPNQTVLDATPGWILDAGQGAGLPVTGHYKPTILTGSSNPPLFTIAVQRKLKAPKDHCTFPKVLPEHPYYPNEYCVSGYSPLRRQNWVTAPETVKILAVERVVTSSLSNWPRNSFHYGPQGPIIFPTDPEYDDQTFWTNQYNAAVANGDLPAGYSYSSTGTGVEASFPKLLTDGVNGTTQLYKDEYVLDTTLDLLGFLETGQLFNVPINEYGGFRSVRLARSNTTGVLNSFMEDLTIKLQGYADNENFALNQQDVDMNNQPIKNLADAEDDSDLLPKSQAEALASG